MRDGIWDRHTFVSSFWILFYCTFDFIHTLLIIVNQYQYQSQTINHCYLYIRMRLRVTWWTGWSAPPRTKRRLTWHSHSTFTWCPSSACSATASCCSSCTARCYSMPSKRRSCWTNRRGEWQSWIKGMHSWKNKWNRQQVRYVSFCWVELNWIMNIIFIYYIASLSLSLLM